MDKQLAKKAGIRFGIGLILVMLLLFLPAGTLRYAGGWRFLFVLFVPMAAMGLILLKKDPALL
ncbi:MAG: isoprenylcysteine carboxylmethyltransferase family protein, partial [Oscillospiraceae bacterium]|nr:isoprenylcysteine carboxylmethyltransferase family protein [Oscillospiraceae bacterium]